MPKSLKSWGSENSITKGGDPKRAPENHCGHRAQSTPMRWTQHRKLSIWIQFHQAKKSETLWEICEMWKTNCKTKSIKWSNDNDQSDFLWESGFHGLSSDPSPYLYLYLGQVRSISNGTQLQSILQTKIKDTTKLSITILMRFDTSIGPAVVDNQPSKSL